jgi:hypothetical protein
MAESIFEPSPWKWERWRVTWNEKAEPHFLERDGVLLFHYYTTLGEVKG